MAAVGPDGVVGLYDNIGREWDVGGVSEGYCKMRKLVGDCNVVLSTGIGLWYSAGRWCGVMNAV